MKEKKKCKCDMNETKEKVVKSGIKVKWETKLGRDKKKRNTQKFANKVVKK